MELSPHPKRSNKSVITLESVAECSVIRDLYSSREFSGGDMLMWRVPNREEALPRSYVVANKLVAGMAKALQVKGETLYRSTGGWETLPPVEERMRQVFQKFTEVELSEASE